MNTIQTKIGNQENVITQRIQMKPKQETVKTKSITKQLEIRNRIINTVPLEARDIQRTQIEVNTTPDQIVKVRKVPVVNANQNGVFNQVADTLSWGIERAGKAAINTLMLPSTLLLSLLPEDMIESAQVNENQIKGRDDAIKELKVLDKGSEKYQELNRLLSVYQSGIHQLSDGEKYQLIEGMLAGGCKEGCSKKVKGLLAAIKKAGLEHETPVETYGKLFKNYKRLDIADSVIKHGLAVGCYVLATINIVSGRKLSDAELAFQLWRF